MADQPEEKWGRHRQIAAGMIPPLKHDHIARLTEWQKLVLSMIGSGLKIKEIAYILRRSPAGMWDLQRRIMDKLETDRTSVMVRYAVEAGLVCRREGGGWVTPAWVARLQPIGGPLVDSAAPGQPVALLPNTRRRSGRQATSQTSAAPRVAPTPDQPPPASPRGPEQGEATGSEKPSPPKARPQATPHRW